MIRFVIVRVLKKLKILRWLNLSVARKLYDQKVRIPLIGNVGYNNLYEWDPWMQHVLKRLDFDEGTFLDVGANIGQTLIKYKTINRNGDYIGLEPNPYCVKYLEQLIKINEYNNIKLIPKALSSSRKELELSLYTNDPTDGMASLVHNYRPHNKVTKRIKVESINGTDLDKSINSKINCIKIDVEGSELNVLENLENQIAKYKPYIIIEILPVYSIENKKRNENQISIEAFIRKNQYSIYLIRNRNSKFEKLVHKPTIGVHNDINQVDYLLIPNEKRESLLKRF